MNISRRGLIKLSAITAVSMAVGGCGGDNDNEFSDDLLSVKLHSVDSMVDCDSDMIILKFNMPMDQETLDQNIYLSDKSGNLLHMHNVVLNFDDVSHQSVHIKLKDSMSLNESWKYSITVTDQVKSISGESLSDTSLLEFTTSSKCPFSSNISDDINRTKIVILSDLHMNEQRGKDDGYSLFTENGELLCEFLESVRVSKQIKEIVILGDLMDMWVVPMAYSTFNDNITNNEEYFQSVANAEVNREVIAKINEIANEGNIRFSYVPGNHDMLFSKNIFYSIFPNGFWEGGEHDGTGVYYPEPDVALEHGHNYDLFNAPDSLTTEGSLLPPGYFITRVYATGNLLNSQKKPIEIPEELSANETEEFLYLTGWGAAMIAINMPNIQYDEPQIVTGVDGYTELYSPDSARDIYTKTIGPNWPQREIRNGVYEHEPFLVAETNGVGTLELSAVTQYFIPQRAKIVVFGHTHKVMIRKSIWTMSKIYANSGTWIDEGYLSTGTLTGTFIIFNTSESSGSDLDNVTVCQAVKGDDEPFTLKKIGEENLDSQVVS